MQRFIIGFIVGIVAFIAVVLLIIAFGGVDMSAAGGPGSFEGVIGSWMASRSVSVRAADEKNPHANDAAAVADGLHHYREMCVQCHGGPGVKSEEFAAGLDPPPPDLGEEAKDWTDGELFWIIKHGIRMTGMPAFGKSHSDDDIWKIVAFVRQLDQLTDRQKAELKKSGESKSEQAQHHD
jgi:mono/diheme cytochrome c family protein